MDRTWGDGKQC